MTAADKNTQVSQQNNIPVINIATPNGAGISHNKFQQFNVDKQGAVLNNATSNVNSQIAGQLKANANLKGNAANLIINEVTGSSRSELQGKLEVAGKGANVLIANPNGITCNGCSFVNTPAITLTTGKPILDNKGALSAVEVKKGSVVNVSNTGNSALIQAQDNLWMQKNAKGDLSTLIENKSGTIKTNAGDLIVRTKKLTNTAITSPIKISNINATTSDKNGTYVSSFFGSRQGVVSIISLYPRLESFPYKKWFGVMDFINNDSINVERKQYLNLGNIGTIKASLLLLMVH
ncbi:filamentous hemagglutinin N-terminal domain-containing protein [Providencia alcalifaciens]|uniref:two-partner secretion domain-containing protein n=1 Tax=Providencia alcalifaciens TaxID=126385 RepID=UPI003EBC3CDE